MSEQQAFRGNVLSAHPEPVEGRAVGPRRSLCSLLLLTASSLGWNGWENPRGTVRPRAAHRRYDAAREAYRTAVRLSPNDQASAAGLRLAERLQLLDPDRPGLRPSERYGRSRELLAAALAAFAPCLASSGGPASLGFATDAAARQEALAMLR